jgi:hypothetical protein
MNRITQIGYHVGWALGLGAVIGAGIGHQSALVVLVPAGVLVVVRGVVLIVNPDGALDSTWQLKLSSVNRAGFRVATRPLAIGMVIVGLGWAAVGIAALGDALS